MWLALLLSFGGHNLEKIIGVMNVQGNWDSRKGQQPYYPNSEEWRRHHQVQAAVDWGKLSFTEINIMI